MEALDGKFLIQTGFCTKNSDKLQGEALEHNPGNQRNHSTNRRAQQECAPHPVIFLCPIVEADDWLAPAGNTNAHRESDHADFHAEAKGSNGNIGAINGKFSILREQVVGDHSNHRRSQIVKATGKTKACQSAHDTSAECKRGFFKPNGLEAEQIGDITQHPDKLRNDSCGSRALDAPLKYKNENGVKNCIQNGSNHHGKHGISGTSIGADR